MNFLPNVLQKFVTAAYFKGLAWYNLGPRVYHSHPQVVSLNPRMKVHVVPALSDNYMYILEDPETKTAAVIDPVEPDKIIEIVQKAELNLIAVLTTHHHWDHAGGNEVIAKKMPNLHIYGGDNRIGALTHHVKHNDTFDLGNLKIRCLFTPCHTSGHICYFVESENEDPIVFTGDTLFTAGCGRFFEGTADQMFEALVNILGSLPDITKVFCGHEYLLQNLAFAAHVEPENEDVKAKIAWAKAKREKSEPTVPSTIGEEKRINPFMRVMEPTVQKYARQGDAVAAMRVIRKEKDTFKAQI